MSKRYVAQTWADGRTFIEEEDTNNGSIGWLLVLALLGFIFIVVTSVIYQKTGFNIFESLEGITGPCGTCTPQ